MVEDNCRSHISFIEHATNLAITYKENNPDHKSYVHASVFVKNGKIIGSGINSLSPMNLLNKNNNIGSIFCHAEINAFRDWISSNKKLKKKFLENKPYILSSFNSHIRLCYQNISSNSNSSNSSNSSKGCRGHNNSCQRFEEPKKDDKSGLRKD